MISASSVGCEAIALVKDSLSSLLDVAFMLRGAKAATGSTMLPDLEFFVINLVLCVAQPGVFMTLVGSGNTVAKLGTSAWSLYGSLGIAKIGARDAVIAIVAHRCMVSEVAKRALLTPVLQPLLRQAMDYMRRTKVLPILVFGTDALSILCSSAVVDEPVAPSVLTDLKVHKWLIVRACKWMLQHRACDPKDAMLPGHTGGPEEQPPQVHMLDALGSL
jgi:hypothetical protein